MTTNPTSRLARNPHTLIHHRPSKVTTMDLEKLIKSLEAAPQNLEVPRGFGDPHSWRGDYHELAFEPMENVKISDMLAAAKSALGTTYSGYKGGEFTMHEWTRVHIEEYGTGDDLMGEMLIWYMLRENNKNETI